MESAHAQVSALMEATQIICPNPNLKFTYFEKLPLFRSMRTGYLRYFLPQGYFQNATTAFAITESTASSGGNCKCCSTPSNLKPLQTTNFAIVYVTGFDFEKIENTVGKSENAGD